MLAFIDVSGDPYGAPEKSPWVAAHTVCIRKRSVYDITAILHRLKRDILVNEYFEMKSTDLVNKSTLNNPHLEKSKFFQAVVEHCLDHCDCKHAAVVFENTGKNQKSNDNRLPRHYIDLLWRIEVIAREWRVNDAVVIIDNNTRKVDRHLAFAFNNYIYRSDGGSMLTKILPVPLFADSETTAGLQLADICAGIIRNYYKNQLNNESTLIIDAYMDKLNEYYNLIKRRSIDGRISTFSINGIFNPQNNYNV